MIKNVLFVCTGNTCRSSMAEAMLRKMLRDNLGEQAATIRVTSAGTSAIVGAGANENAIDVMKWEGIDLHSHRASRITRELVAEADLVLTMTLEQKRVVLQFNPKASDKVFTLSEFANGVNDVDSLLEQLDEVSQRLEEKRRDYLEQNRSKLEELQQKNQELSRQMRALDEELRQIEQKMEQETMNESNEVAQLQDRLAELEIPDPYGQNLEVYQNCAQEIKSKLTTVVQRIKESLQE